MDPDSLAPLYASVSLSKKLKKTRSDSKAVCLELRPTSQKRSKNIDGKSDNFEKRKDLYPLQTTYDSSSPCLSKLNPEENGNHSSVGAVSLGHKEIFGDLKCVANRKHQAIGPSIASMDTTEKKKKEPNTYYEEVEFDRANPSSVVGNGARNHEENSKHEVKVTSSSLHLHDHPTRESQLSHAEVIDSASTTGSGPLESDNTLEDGKSNSAEGRGNISEHSSNCFTYSTALAFLLVTSTTAALIACLCAGIVIYQIHTIDSSLKVQVSSSRLVVSCLNSSKCLHSIDSLNSSFELLPNSHPIKQSLDYYNVSIASLFDSCLSLSRSSLHPPSGYYWMADHNGTPVNVYCEMDHECRGIPGGWTRLIKWENSSLPQADCPWKENHYRDGSQSWEIPRNTSLNISSQFKLKNGVSYSKVCGKIQAFFSGNSSSCGLHSESSCADRISITYGSREMPVWTLSKNQSNGSLSGFVCNDTILKNLTQSTSEYIKVQVFGTAIVLQAMELYVQ